MTQRAGGASSVQLQFWLPTVFLAVLLTVLLAIPLVRAQSWDHQNRQTSHSF